MKNNNKKVNNLVFINNNYVLRDYGTIYSKKYLQGRKDLDRTELLQ